MRSIKYILQAGKFCGIFHWLTYVVFVFSIEKKKPQSFFQTLLCQCYLKDEALTQTKLFHINFTPPATFQYFLTNVESAEHSIKWHGKDTITL